MLEQSLFAYIGPGAGFTFLGSFLILLLTFVLLATSVLTWPFRAVWRAIRYRGMQSAGAAKRVVVVGLDGLDPGRVRRLIAAGQLGRLKELGERGTFVDLASTLPPISPVAWSSFSTGVNPGKHNIFDFLNRDLRTYLPELSSAKVTADTGAGWLSRLGLGGSPVRLLRKSQPFWRVLGEHGVFSTILRVPITFPPEKFHGLSLSAMCTPDLRGSQGTFTFYTTDREACRSVTGGQHLHVARTGNRIETYLAGPPNRPGCQPADLQTPLVVQLEPARDEAVLHICGQKIRLKKQQCSGWVRVTFRAGLLAKVHGICQFRLGAVVPEFTLYVTPINIDPERPALPISHPLYYSMYLAKLHDRFATLGLAEDTWALNSGAISEEAFLDQAYSIHAERERMFFDALRRTRRGLCACVFDASDRIQHMFYRYENAAHPANEGKDRERHLHAIDNMYRRMDELVGRVVDAIDDETVLMVISDHGFCDFSWGVNLNVWLREQGYLFLKEHAAPGDYFGGVDWSKTRAYAFGLTGIYLNQSGRESQGIVDGRDEAAALKTEIAGRLRDLWDADRNQRPILEVYDSRKVYAGPYAGNGPDLVVGYNRGYRAAWDTVVGRVEGQLIEGNTRHWSGDHCVDPSAVPGVFFCNRRLQEVSAGAAATGPGITDLAPTILKLFGVGVPAYMDGRPLSLIDNDAKVAANRQVTP